MNDKQNEAVELDESALEQASGGQVIKPTKLPTPKESDPEGGGEFA